MEDIMKKSFLLLGLYASFAVEGSTSHKIKRSFSTYPHLDELKWALIKEDWEKIRELMPYRFPTHLHAQYLYLAFSDKQKVRDFILNEIFVQWNLRILETPLEALNLLRRGLTSLFRDYRTNLDKGFLDILSRLQVALLMCPAISDNHELYQAALKIAPMRNIFMTAYVFAIPNQQGHDMRDRRAYVRAHDRPFIAPSWPLHVIAAERPLDEPV
jgi:hypothetical protein